MSYDDKKILKSRGYSEKEIELILDNYHSVELFDDAMAPGRKDKGVVVKDPSGETKRTSNLMFGYNKDDIVLPNGELVNVEEIELALKKTLSEISPNAKLVVRKTGKRVNSDYIVKTVISAAKKAGFISYSESDLSLNQDVRQVYVTGAGRDTKKSQGLVMLGNEKVELPCGEYVGLAEIILALSEYVILDKKIIGIEKNEFGVSDKKDEKIVITRIQRNLIPALATATAVIELFSFLSITPPTAEQVANYTINHQGTSYVYETDSQARNRLIGSLELGETIDLKDGLTYYESSDYDMGGKLKVDI